MRKIISFGVAAVLTLAAVVTWATATTHLTHRGGATASFGDTINPFDLMKQAKDLPHQQPGADPF
jgi:hypothetical protein